MKKFRVEIKNDGNNKLTFTTIYRAKIRLDTKLAISVSNEPDLVKFNLKNHIKGTMEAQFNGILKEIAQLNKIEQLTSEIIANVEYPQVVISKAYDILKLIQTNKMCEADDFTM